MKKQHLLIAAIIALAAVSIAAYSTTLHGRGAYELINWYAIRINDALTNTVTHQRLEHSTSGTAAAGSGMGLKLYSETASGTAEHIGGIYAKWTTATGGGAASDLCLQNVSSSTASDVACWDSGGDLYKSTAATNTPLHYVFEARSTGTAAAGFGSGLHLWAETANGDTEHVGGVYSALTTATGGAVVSSTCLQTVNASTAVDALCLTGEGSLSVASPQKLIYLLGSSVIDVGATGTYTHYTVPASKTAIVTDVVVRSASASFDQATDPDFQIGCNSTDYNNLVATATYTTPSVTSSFIRPTVIAEAGMCAAASTIRTNVTVAATASTTATVDVFGYLF
jgi:hypothetical protein